MAEAGVFAARSQVRLADAIANRRWLLRTRPFPHVVARGVFTAGFHAALAGQLGEILGHGLSEAPDGERFSRAIPGYDAYGISLTEATPDPLALFVSPQWRDLLCGLFGIGRTPYVYAGAHHHLPDSGDGFVHDDFNAVWFPRAREREQIQLPREDLCAYKSGAGPLAEEEKVEVARGAVVIYFLRNDGWRPGDGGETGLYASREATEPDARAGPESNSLVAFECTPRSFHGFLSNRRLPRTSIIMWVHRPLREAVERYGEEQLERWAS